MSTNKNKTSYFLNDIRKYSKENLIDKILVAVSGGADSISLLYALKEAGLECCALHCNFNLRGEESIRDKEFVINFCIKNQIPFKIKEFDVKDYLTEHKGISLEMACRELRYNWFEECLIGNDYKRIAVGHNADDNIETFFLNMLRGSGTAGLKGMEYDNGKIWRPLLHVHKKVLIDFLRDRNLDFIIDSTNLNSDFRRNFIRNKVLPLIKEQWPGYETTLDKTISNIYEENKLVEKTLNDILSCANNKLPIETILSFPASELLIRRFISKLKPFNTTAAEILSAIKANKPHSPIWILPGGKITIKKRHLVLLEKD